MKKFNNSITTPIPVLNVLGGLRHGTITELFGPSKSGKSTVAYQMLHMGMEAYPDGKYIVLDSENALDELRLEHAFGIDCSKLDIKTFPTLEDNFKYMIDQLKSLEPDQHCIIVWDTIAECSTELQSSKQDSYAGGRQEEARVIKFWSKQLVAVLHDKKAHVVVLNQVYHGEHGAYVSGGGEAFKHNCHYTFKFKIEKVYYDEYNTATATFSRVTTDKSRFFPAIKDIPLWIDSSLGGVIDYERSLILAGVEYGLVQKSKNGYYWIGAPKSELSDEEYGRIKKYLAADFQNQKELMLELEDEFEKFFRKRYRLIDLMYSTYEVFDVIPRKKGNIEEDTVVDDAEVHSEDEVTDE
jgi:RecA/RadA recombinase